MDERTLQERIREMHQEFAPIQHLPEAGRETFDVCKRLARFVLNSHSSAFFELRPDIELALQKAQIPSRWMKEANGRNKTEKNLVEKTQE